VIGRLFCKLWGQEKKGVGMLGLFHQLLDLSIRCLSFW
jgi:hypothetical protein